MGCPGKLSLIHGSPTSQLSEIEGSTADVLVPDTKANLQKSSGVNVLLGKGRNSLMMGVCYNIRPVDKMLWLIDA